MKFKPILFSPPMVQAIIDERKSMTRRLAVSRSAEMTALLVNLGAGCDMQRSTEELIRVHAPYQKGDCLWVREEHYVYGEWATYLKKKTPTGKDKTRFMARPDAAHPSMFFPGSQYDGGITVRSNTYKRLGYYKRLGRFMPASYARIFLEVTDVRVERLQDITPADACDEGVEFWNVDAEAFEGGELIADYKNYTWRDDESYEDYHFPHFANPVDSFRTLFESLHGHGAWTDNSYVWPISFKRIDKPANFLS
jgi:hypothetical protein